MSYAKPFAVETSKPVSFARDAAIVILASLVIGLFAKISIPLPFTPVPIGTQNSVILLMAAFLGARRAAAATFAFLVQGAAGFPVFAGGVGGMGKFFGPTGGYLIGYLAAAFVVGLLIEKYKEKTVSKTFFALAAGHAFIYLFGAAYLSAFVGFQKALLLGVAPFLVGDLLKIVASLKILNWIGSKR